MKKYLLSLLYIAASFWTFNSAQAQNPTLSEMVSVELEFGSNYPRVVYGDCSSLGGNSNTVSLSGTNLSQVTEIYLNGNPSSTTITSIDNNSITFTINDLSFSNINLSGPITLNTSSEEFIFTDFVLTVIGCPSSPFNFNTYLTVNQNSYIVINGSDLNNVDRYEIIVSGKTFSGSTFYSKSTSNQPNSLYIPINTSISGNASLNLIQLNKFLVIGEYLFNINASNGILINDFSPKTVAGGDIVTVSGDGLDNVSTSFYFNDILNIPIQNEPNFLTFEAPKFYTIEPYSAPLIIHGSFITQEFLTIQPTQITITSAVQGGMNLTIQGNNLGDYNEYLKPSWKILLPDFSYASDASLKDENSLVILLQNPISGEITILGTFLENLGTYPITNTSLPSNISISSVDPNPVDAGETITVNGSGFSNFSSINSIKIGETEINDYTVIDTPPTETLLQINTQYDIPSLVGPITLSDGVYTVTSSFDVTIVGLPRPTVTGVNPTTFSGGDLVTISGLGFTSLNSIAKYIFFSNENIDDDDDVVEIVYINNRTIVFKAPKYKDQPDSKTTRLRVAYEYTEIFFYSNFNNSDLTLNLPPTPTITGFFPTSGPPGTIITFTGPNARFINSIQFSEEINDYELQNLEVIPSNINDNIALARIPIVHGINYAFQNYTASGIFKYSQYAFPTEPITTSSAFTVTNYPQPEVTTILSPVKIYPNSTLTIIGNNLNPYLNNYYNRSILFSTTSGVYFEIDERNSNNNKIIFNMYIDGDVLPVTDYVKLRYNIVPTVFDLTITSPITIHPYDGDITILGISSNNLTSSSMLTLTVLSSGVFYNDINNCEGDILLEWSSPDGIFVVTVPSDNIQYVSFKTSQLTPGINIIQSEPLYNSFTDNRNNLNRYLELISGSNYKLRFTYYNTPNDEPRYSNTISGISFKREPIFIVPDYPFSPVNASGGQEITIKGNHFLNSTITSVLVNNLTVNSYLISDDKITLTLPGGDIKGPIKINYEGGAIQTQGKVGDNLGGLVITEDIYQPDLKGNNVFTAGGTFMLSVNSDKVGEEITLTVQISDTAGSFVNNSKDIGAIILNPAMSFELFNEFDPNYCGKGLLNFDIPCTIPSSSFTSSNYKLRIKLESELLPGQPYVVAPFVPITIIGNTLNSLLSLSIPESAIQNEVINVTLTSSIQNQGFNYINFSLVDAINTKEQPIFLQSFSGINPLGIYPLTIPSDILSGVYFVVAEGDPNQLSVSTITSSSTITILPNVTTVVPAFAFSLSVPDSLAPIIDYYYGSLPVEVSFNPSTLDSVYKQVLFTSSNSEIAIVEVFYPSEPNDPNFDPKTSGINPNPPMSLAGVYFPGAQVWVSARGTDGIVSIKGTSIFNPTVTSTLVITVTNQSIVGFDIIIADENGNTDSLLIDEFDGTLQLVAEFEPSAIPTNLQRVRWVVSDTNLASINQEGLLTAKRNGVVTVTAISRAISTISGSATVKLINQYEPLTGFYIASEDSTNLFPLAFGELAIFGYFTPENATYAVMTVSVNQGKPLVSIQPQKFDDEVILEISREFKENGVVTVIGTAFDERSGARFTSYWVLTTVGQINELLAGVVPRSLDKPNKAPNNPCESTVVLELEQFEGQEGVNILGYEWYYVDGSDTLRVAGANQPTYEPKIPGLYFAYAYDTEYNYLYLPFNLTVTAPITPVITSQGRSEAGTTLDTLLKVEPIYASYQWYVNGKLIKGENKPQLRVFYNGDYTVAVTNESKCTATSEPFKVARPDFVDIGRGNVYATDSTIELLRQPVNNASILLYPNPNNGTFTVEYYSTTKRFITVSLFNIFGQAVYTTTIEDTKNATRYIHIDQPQLQPGVYNLQVIDGDLVTYKRITIK